MNTRKKIRKGFTIVEFVIVIAIVAVLAAVLIPTFASLISTANLSSDIQAVKQMNTVLMTESAIEKPDTFEDIKKILSANGFNAEEGIVPVSKDHRFVWCSGEINLFALIELNTDAGLATLIYPDDNDALETKITYANYIAGTEIFDLGYPDDGQGSNHVGDSINRNLKLLVNATQELSIVNVADGTNVQWESSAPYVVAISAVEGEVNKATAKALKVGTATVTAVNLDDPTTPLGTWNITVTVDFEITSSIPTIIEAGSPSYQLEWQFKGANGVPVEADEVDEIVGPITWSSDNTEALEVTDGELIVCQEIDKETEVTITAEVNDSINKQIKIKVTPVAVIKVESIQFDDDAPKELFNGQDIDLNEFLFGTDSNGKEVPAKNLGNINWECSTVAAEGVTVTFDAFDKGVLKVENLGKKDSSVTITATVEGVTEPAEYTINLPATRTIDPNSATAAAELKEALENGGNICIKEGHINLAISAGPNVGSLRIDNDTNLKLENGASVSFNFSSGYGLDVYADKTFNIDGGKVTFNTGNTCGVYVKPLGTLNITNAEIHMISQYSYIRNYGNCNIDSCEFFLYSGSHGCVLDNSFMQSDDANYLNKDYPPSAVLKNCTINVGYWDDDNKQTITDPGKLSRKYYNVINNDSGFKLELENVIIENVGAWYSDYAINNAGTMILNGNIFVDRETPDQITINNTGTITVAKDSIVEVNDEFSIYNGGIINVDNTLTLDAYIEDKGTIKNKQNIQYNLTNYKIIYKIDCNGVSGVDYTFSENDYESELARFENAGFVVENALVFRYNGTEAVQLPTIYKIIGGVKVYLTITADKVTLDNGQIPLYTKGDLVITATLNLFEEYAKCVQNGGRALTLECDWTVSSVIEVGAGSVINLNGHKLSFNKDGKFNITSGNSLTINGSKTKSEGAEEGVDVQYAKAFTLVGSSLTFNNVKLTATNDAIDATNDATNGAVVNIIDCSVTSNSPKAIYVCDQNTDDDISNRSFVNISNSSFDVYGTAIFVCGEYPSVDISNSSFNVHTNNVHTNSTAIKAEESYKRVTVNISGGNFVGDNSATIISCKNADLKFENRPEFRGGTILKQSGTNTITGEARVYSGQINGSAGNATFISYYTYMVDGKEYGEPIEYNYFTSSANRIPLEETITVDGMIYSVNWEGTGVVGNKIIENTIGDIDITINGTKTLKLKETIEKAATSPLTIVLDDADVEIASAIPIASGQDITINLNNKTLDLKGAKLTVNGKLTINGEGTLTVNGMAFKVLGSSNEQALLTLNNVTVSGNGAGEGKLVNDTNRKTYDLGVVYCRYLSKTVLNNCTFEITSGRAIFASSWEHTKDNDRAYIYINGGTFNSSGSGDTPLIQNYDGGSMYFDDYNGTCTTIGTSGNVALKNYGRIYLENDVYVTGGAFVCDANCAFYPNNYNLKGTITYKVTADGFERTWSETYNYAKEYGKANYTNKSADVFPPEYMEFDGKTYQMNWNEASGKVTGNVTFTGTKGAEKVITVKEQIENAWNSGNAFELKDDVVLNESITVAAGKKVTINLNGKTLDLNDESFTIYGTLTINGTGKILVNGQAFTVDMDDDFNMGKLVINNVTITGNGSANGIIYTNFTTELSGCTITADTGNALRNNGSLVLNSCTFTANTGYALYNGGSLVLKSDIYITKGAIKLGSNLDDGDGRYNFKSKVTYTYTINGTQHTLADTYYNYSKSASGDSKNADPITPPPTTYVMVDGNVYSITWDEASCEANVVTGDVAFDGTVTQMELFAGLDAYDGEIDNVINLQGDLTISRETYTKITIPSNITGINLGTHTLTLRNVALVVNSSAVFNITGKSQSKHAKIEVYNSSDAVVGENGNFEWTNAHTYAIYTTGKKEVNLYYLDITNFGCSAVIVNEVKLDIQYCTFTNAPTGDGSTMIYNNANNKKMYLADCSFIANKTTENKVTAMIYNSSTALIGIRANRTHTFRVSDGTFTYLIYDDNTTTGAVGVGDPSQFYVTIPTSGTSISNEDALTEAITRKIDKE